jgi:tape measure domain-containing protein
MSTANVRVKTIFDGNGFKSGLSSMESKTNSSTGKMSSMFKKLAITVGAVLSVQQVVNWGRALIKASDQYTSAMSRLNMMTNGNKKASEGLYKSVVASANRSRGSINDMMDTVGKLGIMAKSAFKGGNKEVVAFAEQINKLGVISGSTTQEMNAGMMQLEQSLASGKLQGDELRSVLENMPGVAKTLAQGLGVSTGELRNMGAQGKLTSDVVVGAIMKMKGQTDKDFNSMGWTFAQTWQVFKNKATEALQPAFKELSKFANSADFKQAMQGLAGIVGKLAGGIVVMVKGFIDFFKLLKTHSGLIGGLAIAFGSLGAAMIAINIAAKIVLFARFAQTVFTALTMIKSFAGLGAVLQAGMAAIGGPVVVVVAAIVAFGAAMAVLYHRNEQFRNIVNGAWTQIKNAITTAWNMVKPAFTALGQALGFTSQKAQSSKQHTSALGTVLTTVVGPAFAGTARLVSALIKVLGSFVSGVVYLVAAVVRIFKGDWGGAWNMAKKAAHAALDGIRHSFSALTAFLPKNIRNKMNAMVKAGEDLILGLGKGIEKKVKWVIKKIAGVGKKIKDKFKEILGINSPSTVFYDFGVFIFQGLENALTASPFGALGEKIATRLSDSFSNNAALPAPDAAAALQGPANAASANAGATISGGMAASIDAVKNQQAPMDTAAKSVFETLPKNANDKSQKAKTQVTEQLIATSNWVDAAYPAQLSQSARSAFDRVRAQAADRTMAAKQSSIRTLLSTTQWMVTTGRVQFNSAGRNTMQGFVNGMASQRGNVTSTANSLVKAVKDAFVKGLGIHSPSQYMTWVGRNTGLGLIKGLQSTQLGKFAKNTVGEMKSAFAKSKFSAEANVNYMDDDSMKEVHWMRKYDGGSVVKGADGGKGNRFVNHMLGLVNDDRHGYSQARRWGPDYDCSSSIIASLRAAGFNTGAASTTHNMSSELTKHGWMRLPYRNPKKGDILLNDATHTEMSLGNGKTAGFHSSHGHPEPGDQAHEAYVGRDPGRWAAILRYKHGFGDSLADAIEEAYNFKKYGFGSLDAEGDGGDLGGAGEKVTGKLADWIKSALKATHQPQSLLAGLIRAAKAESGGNPRAVNNWDINAKLGHPSKGLFQTIDSTFQAYKLKGHGNIYNPIDNAIAAIRYMIARYGSVENVLRPRAKRWYGYAVGSRYITHDQFAQLHEGEAVIRANENPYKNSKGGFITPILEKIVLAEMSRIASRAAAGVSGSGGNSTDDHPVEITQKIYFQETPKQPSEFRAELRQAGRRLAFG